jgi:hypothetical protein
MNKSEAIRAGRRCGKTDLTNAIFKSIKNSEINIAIAEACGWVDFVTSCFGVTTGKYGDYEEPYEVIPDYCNDLNAMHEAEKILFSKGHTEDPEETNYYQDEYADELYSICECDELKTLHATASQRAEAFLKTIGKWKDSNE